MFMGVVVGSELRRIGSVDVPGAKHFVFRDRFLVVRGGDWAFKLDGVFKFVFEDCVEEDIVPATIVIDEVRADDYRYHTTLELIKEKVGDPTKISLSLAHLSHLLEKQIRGEAGSLRVNAHTYLLIHMPIPHLGMEYIWVVVSWWSEWRKWFVRLADSQWGEACHTGDCILLRQGS